MLRAAKSDKSVLPAPACRIPFTTQGWTAHSAFFIPPSSFRRGPTLGSCFRSAPTLKVVVSNRRHRCYGAKIRRQFTGGTKEAHPLKSAPKNQAGHEDRHEWRPRAWDTGGLQISSRHSSPWAEATRLPSDHRYAMALQDHRMSSRKGVDVKML